MTMPCIILLEDGVEDSEFETPLARLRDAGLDVLVAGAEADKECKGKRGGTFRTDVAVDDVDAAQVDVLVIPGGQAPDKMRMNRGFVDLARQWVEGDTVVAAICHGPQLLIEADVVSGRRMTSWSSVRTDLRNAGAEVVDETVVVDGNLITSRKLDDLDAFCDAILQHVEAPRRV